MRQSFEDQFKLELDKFKANYKEQTNATQLADFKVQIYDKWFNIELKEKKAPYKPDNWACFKHLNYKESQWFIEDELSIRKLFLGSVDALLIVKDVPMNRFILFTPLDLLLCPKNRCNRQVSGRSGVFHKGKWLMRMDWGVEAKTLQELFSLVIDYIKDTQTPLKTECFGPFKGEVIGVGGTVRGNYYKKKDLQEK